jgi:selenocysteine-specific elongation factor
MKRQRDNSPSQPNAAATGRVVIATAGHVDHGKTALIRALTGTDTDRLPDEKRRGISIELGFAELAGTGISFIDVPGHHKLVHAMIAGVGGVDGVLLVVAADDGVMPQTREHLAVCVLSGIERVVVALTKVDLVDAETLELAEADVRATLETLGLEPLAIVPVSAPQVRGLDELRRALEALQASVPPRASSARVWLAVDRVFSVKGAGTVVTGTLTRGSVRVGQTLFVTGEHGTLEVVARSLEIHGRAVELASAPTRLAVNLARVEVADVHRGDVLSADPELCRARALDVALGVLPGAERSLERRKPVTVHVGTARATARAVRLDDAIAHLKLDAALPAEGGAGVVLRGFRATREHGAVLGGGRILDANAARLPRHSSAAWRRRLEALTALAQGDVARALELELELRAPRPVSAEDLERRFGLEPGRVRELFERGRISGAVGLAEGLWIGEAALEKLEAALVKRLALHHAERPHEAGASRETLRAWLGERAGRAAAERAIEQAVGRGAACELAQGLLCLPSFASSAAPGAQKSAGRLLEALDTAELEGVSEAALVARTGERPEVVHATLGRLAAAGRVRRLSGMWFSEERLEALRVRVREYFSSHASLSVPDFKELAGVSRKQAIPLLEQLDREGTTRRQGNERVAGVPGRPASG